MHGFLSITALAINLATVFYVMIPTFSTLFSVFSEMPILQMTIVWVHIITGMTAIALGIVIIASWVIHPLGELGCSRTWKLMIPTFAIWSISLIFGAIIHILNII
jgi:hypothetical protein